MAYKELAIGFARSGILGYGGGPSVIPLIHHEAVVKYKWMTDDEFGDVLAMANALPGPIATKMAAYIGYKVKGSLGALVAVLSHVVPTILAMVVLLGSIYALKGSSVVRGMIEAVGPVIAVMLGVMSYEFFIKSWKGLGKSGAVGATLLCVVALYVLHIHPAIVIAVFMVISLLQSWMKGRVEKSVSKTPVGRGTK